MPGQVGWKVFGDTGKFLDQLNIYLNKKSLPDFSERLWSGWQDSNLRPPGPKPGAITGLRYIPNLKLGNRTLAERVGFEPTVQFNPYDDLANRSFRPLRHLS